MDQTTKKATKIYKIRHSLAHLLAIVALEHDKGAKLTIGPAVENGFYYDIDFSEGKAPTPEDLKHFQKAIKKLIGKKLPFEGREVSEDEARKIFAGNPYKLEIIDGIVKMGEKITVYQTSEFVDLCEGGHVENTSEIDVDGFKLDRIAGAYWRGDEKNKMLTRVYGLAFETGKELDDYLTLIEEAKKRDHRKLGKELGLFTIIDEVGGGLPLFYPKGAILRRLIENYITEEQEKRGYLPIWIPHITKGELYKISGHLDKYDAMYPPMKLKGEDDYYLKPMNCPHFMMLYKTLPHSYRELPLRYTCTTTNYRYEKSGELSGLTRVRSLTQDDCHVFCTASQIEDEISLMLGMIAETYKKFGLEDFYVRVSLKDPKSYIGSDEAWETAENALRTVVKKTGWKYTEEAGEAAFYGPKLDFIFKDALGREWQLSTIQLDFNLPERFELEYADSEGEKSRPVVIHRAILGSTERFLGIFIEHTAGNFPFWLSPVQVWVLPITDAHKEYAEGIFKILKSAGVRAELHDESETLGKKIRNGKMQKIPYLLVIGDKEMETKTVTLEGRDHGNMGAISLDELFGALK